MSGGTGNPMAKVKAGDKLKVPAEAYNAFIDAAIAERGRSLDRGGGQLHPLTHRASVVPTKNDTGAALPRFSILGIDSPLLDPDLDPDGFKAAVVLRGVAPTAAHAASGAILITVEPIAANAIGWGVVSGAAICQVNVVDEAHRRAICVVDYTGALQSGPGGLPILWREGGTGTQWAVVCVGSIGLEASLPVRYPARISATTVAGDALWVEQDVSGPIPTDKVNGMTGTAREISGRKKVPPGTMIEVFLLQNTYWYTLGQGAATNSYFGGPVEITLSRDWDINNPPTVSPNYGAPGPATSVRVTVLASRLISSPFYPNGYPTDAFWCELTYDTNGNLLRARPIIAYTP